MAKRETQPTDLTMGFGYQVGVRRTLPLEADEAWMLVKSHSRVTRHPEGWPRASTIRVRALDKGDNSVVAFHSEHLPDTAERESRRAHFAAVLDDMERMVSA